VSSPSSTDQDIIAIATNEHIIAAACAAAVPAIELIIACIAFHLVVTAHAEQRIVTREAFKQITTTPAGQLFSFTGTSDDRIVFTVGFTCGNALINLGGRDHVAAVRLHPVDRVISTEKMIYDSNTSLSSVVYEENKVISVSGETDPIFGGTAREHHAIAATIGIVDSVMARSG